jgi:glycosyltransferase involved in cell wall biosynthesis
VRVLVLGTWSHGGFGKVTVELSTRFLAAGHDIRILAVDHRGEPITGPLNGRVWPASMLGGSHGKRTDTAIDGTFWRKLDPRDQWTPEAVLAIEDMSGLMARMNLDGQFNEVWTKVPIWHYCPIEGDNLPPFWAKMWSFVRPVAMSDYGASEIAKLIGTPVPRIYHGVDSETYRPASITDPIVWDGKRLGTKDACKAAFGINPKRKIILRSDALVVRKFYDRLIAALVPILFADPDTDVLLHTTASRDDIDLTQELLRMPVPLQGRVKITGMHDTWVGLPTEGMVALMNAADLYVSTTGGEGFGLNLAESLACEVPVVVTDWAADAEVVGPGGILVPPLTDSYGEPVRFHSTYGMDWAVPDPRGFVEPVLNLLAKPSKRRELGALGRSHVARFSWDTAAAEFLTLLEDRHELARAG